MFFTQQYSLQKMLLGKLRVFVHTLFLKNKEKNQRKKYRVMFFYSIEIQALLRKKRSSFSVVLHSPFQLCTTFALYRPRTRNRIKEHSHIKLFPCIKFEVMDRELACFSTGDSWISWSISDHLPLQGNAEVPLSTLT